ncbi:MAG: TIR domain-containing protein [Methanothrix sp.]
MSDESVEQWRQADEELRKNLPPGVKLVRTLRGHMGWIGRIAWSPDGRMLASPSADGTILLWNVETGERMHTLVKRQHAMSVAFDPTSGIMAGAGSSKTVKLWEPASGKLLRTLKGHQSGLMSVAFDPTSGIMASASFDKTVKLWEPTSGKLLRTLEGHQNSVSSVAFDPTSGIMASASFDKTVKLWEPTSGKLLRTLEGHQDSVSSVAFDPTSGIMASASFDKTVKLWEPTSGKLLRTLEVHTYIRAVCFSNGGQILYSSGSDSIRLWRIDTGACVAIIPMHASDYWPPGLAFHPSLPILATVGSDNNVSEACFDRVIHIWELDPVVLLNQPATTSVTYTSAKIVLVGDTGVGKSGLAERLVWGRFVPTESSHARRAYVLESQVVQNSDKSKVQREIVLWDLAGQPAYRLVHQLSMEDAALACVLFDARSETNPFEGAAYWSQVLDQARTNTGKKLIKFLVASRSDVGGLPAGADRINAFVRENGFAGLFKTSAKTGEGCGELLQAIRQAIPWEDLPSVSSPEVLRKLREFVAGLNPARSSMGAEEVPALVTIAELLQRFESACNAKVPLEDFIAYLLRLEASDTADVLVFHTTGEAPKLEDKVLLDTTRVDAYSSALLVTARDEPDGPGHLLESRARIGEFTLNDSERIDPRSERHLLWFVVENLLSRDLALRERIRGKDYLVFPSQCTTGLSFPGGGSFAVAFGISGAVRSIYATLIAQLAHYEGFKRRQFFRDAAAYWTEGGQRCYVHLICPTAGSAELKISFDDNTPIAIRQGFIEFVAKHLESKSEPGQVARRYAYYCSNAKCRNPFEDRVVKARLKAHRKYLICPICEVKTSLVNLLAPLTAEAETVAEQMDCNARTGRQRLTAAWVIKAKKAEGKFDVFLSHNSKDKAEVEKIANRLLAVGIRPWLDKWDLAPGDTVSDALEHAIKTIPCAALCFGPADTGNWHVMEIRAYVEAWAKKEARMIPLILPGADKPPELPLFVRQTLWVDMRYWQNVDDDGFYRLVCGILGQAPGNSPLRSFGVRQVAEWQGLD